MFSERLNVLKPNINLNIDNYLILWVYKHFSNIRLVYKRLINVFKHFIKREDCLNLIFILDYDVSTVILRDTGKIFL